MAILIVTTEIYIQLGRMLVTQSIGKLRRVYYTFVNRLVLYRKSRWAATLVCVFFYIQTAAQVSFDIATYLIGFYLLQLLVSYLTPRGVSEETNEPEETEGLYSMADNLDQIRGIQAGTWSMDGSETQHAWDKPLLRSLSEMEIWERATFAFLLGLACTYFKMFEIDVFWPLLLVYFILLVCYTIQKILRTMDRHRYGLSDFQKQPR